MSRLEPRKKKSLLLFLFPILLVITACEPAYTLISGEYSITGTLEVAPEAVLSDPGAPATIEFTYLTSGVDCELPTDEKPLFEVLGTVQPTQGSPEFGLSGTRSWWRFEKRVGVCGQTTMYEIKVSCPPGTQAAGISLGDSGTLDSQADFWNDESSIWVVFEPPQTLRVKVLCGAD